MIRTRRTIAHIGGTCSLCGHAGLVLTESRFVRRGLNVLRPTFDADVRLYELCDGCGAKHPVEAAASNGGDALDRTSSAVESVRRQ